MKGISLQPVWEQIKIFPLNSPLFRPNAERFTCNHLLSSLLGGIYTLEQPRQHRASPEWVTRGPATVVVSWFCHSSPLRKPFSPRAPPLLHTRPIQAPSCQSTCSALCSTFSTGFLLPPLPESQPFPQPSVLCLPSWFWFTCSSDRISYLVAVFVFASLFPVEQTLFFCFTTPASACVLRGLQCFLCISPCFFPQNYIKVPSSSTTRAAAESYTHPIQPSPKKARKVEHDHPAPMVLTWLRWI